MIDRLQQHFGFTKMPFGRDLAPGMLHRHAAHTEAAARITWTITDKALGVITGEVGVGKTVEHPGFGGDSILPRCSGLGGRCLPRYRRLAEPRSDHFPLLFYRTSVQLRCSAAPPGGGLCPPGRPLGGVGISSSGNPFCAAGSPSWARVTRSVIAWRRRRRP